MTGDGADAPAPPTTSTATRAQAAGGPMGAAPMGATGVPALGYGGQPAQPGRQPGERVRPILR